MNPADVPMLQLATYALPPRYARSPIEASVARLVHCMSEFQLADDERQSIDRAPGREACISPLLGHTCNSPTRSLS